MTYHHYHVVGGLSGGYLPDYNYVFHNRLDARRAALRCVADERVGENDETIRWRGNGRVGYWYEVTGGNRLGRCVELNLCVEDNCVERRGGKFALRDCYCDGCIAVRRRT